MEDLYARKIIERANTHIQVFRKILSDCKQRFGNLIPADIDPEGNIENLIRYITPPFGNYGFGIGDFIVSNEEPVSLTIKAVLNKNTMDENEALLEIYHIDILSGRNWLLKYKINVNKSVTFLEDIGPTFIS